jgi:hypothetical protein
VVNAIAKGLYFRYAGTRKSVVYRASASLKHAKISFVRTNGSGFSISRDLSDDLELISDFEGNNLGNRGLGR